MPFPTEPNVGGYGLHMVLTNYSDVFFADAAQATALIAANPGTTWSSISALSGDDEIYRDRSGSYALGNMGEHFGDLVLDGGSGFDTVNYSLAGSALFADLAAGVGETDDFGGKVFNDDVYVSIEGIVGSHFDDTILGNDFANYLAGLHGDDVIDGNGGDDTIEGGVGEDNLFGGAGDDTIRGGDDDDAIWGEGGRDYIEGEQGADIVHGGAGNDEILGGSGVDTLNGGNGHDTIDGGGDGDEINGGSGNDDIDGGGGGDVMDGGSGNDTLRMNGDDVAVGGTGADTFRIGDGWGGNDFDGESGADTAIWEGGVDLIVDMLNGMTTRGPWVDTFQSIRDVETGGGDDIVFGTAGFNEIRTGGGADIIYTIGGDDFVNAGGGDDIVVGYSGSETIHGGRGDDTVDGHGGDDAIFGGRGHDDLDGGSGDDAIDGGRGADTINGGDGDDTIDGGGYGDRIRGGAGFDEMTGGLGVDTFVWAGDDHKNAIDVIWDFNGQVDQLAFGEGFLQLNAVGATSASDVLNAYDGWGGTILEARTADDGWSVLAVITNPGQTASINQRIANGSILDVAVNDPFEGGPGGWAPAELGGDFVLDSGSELVGF